MGGQRVKFPFGGQLLCSPFRLWLLCLVLLIAFVTSVQASANHSVSLDISLIESVREEARKASGILPEKGIWRMTGTARFHGTEQAFALDCDDRFRFRIKMTGALSESQGFDGKDYWSQMFSGTPHRVIQQERDNTQLFVWTLTGQWAVKSAPLQISAGDTSPGKITLRLLPRHGVAPGVLHLDAATRLPKSLHFTSASGGETWTFSDYRVLGGRMLPGRIIHRSGQQEDSITLTAAMRVTGEIVRWRMPAPDPESAVFDPNANRTVEIKSVMNLIFIRPRIDGQDIGWFFLDTGADAMCLDSAVAKRLGLPVIGSDTVAGAVGVSHLQICRGSTFQVGPLTLKQPVFLALDLAPFAQLLKLPIVGICGYDFLARVALDIDLKASTLRMFPPGKAALPEGASWSRIWFESNTPGVYCRFEGGRRGFFTLDTGSNETVDFFSPAVVRFRLLENRKVNSARTGGAGGVTESKTGALDWFELGGTRIEKPLVGFQTAQEGIFSNPYRVGNIGMGLLGRFRLILDYAHERIAFISPENAADKAE